MEQSIRELYFKILDFEGEGLYESVLKKWIIDNDYKSYLLNLSNKVHLSETSLSQDDIWELYALTRVLDILSLRFQPNNNVDESKWLGLNFSIPEYIEFNYSIGLDTTTPKTFNSFDCEILEANEGENNFQIVECLFPAIKLKNLMIKRAGVKISLDSKNYNLKLINHSSIYWTFRRQNRKCFDLSQGWGSNSQWRTDIRLDIETNDSYIYNQKGIIDFNNLTINQLNVIKEQNLDVDEAIELTKFRHFINSTKNDSDLFPYDFKYEEKKSQV